MVILANSILLAMDDPTTQTDNNATQDLVLLIIYTVEMVLKIIAYGLIVNKDSYLRDAWNILDLIIIITGYLPYIFTSNQVRLTALRSLRVLRPLKTISKLKALQSILRTLFSSLPLMKDAILLLSFYYIVFAIAGLQLFSGLQKKRCLNIFTGLQKGDDIDNLFICSEDQDCSNFNNNDESYVCSKFLLSPKYDTSNFDTIGWSVLNVYIIVSLEGWADLQEYIQESFSYFALFYFIFCIFIGTFFLMNLMMAILEVKYYETRAVLMAKNSNAIASNQKASYNFKDFIKWGLYKSNKQRYKEIEQKIQEAKSKKNSKEQKTQINPLDLILNLDEIKDSKTNSAQQKSPIVNESQYKLNQSQDKSPLFQNTNETPPKVPNLKKCATISNQKHQSVLKKQMTQFGLKKQQLLKQTTLRNSSINLKKRDSFESFNSLQMRKHKLTQLIPIRKREKGTGEIQTVDLDQGLLIKNSSFFNSSKLIQTNQDKSPLPENKSSGQITNFSRMKTLHQFKRNDASPQAGYLRVTDKTPSKISYSSERQLKMNALKVISPFQSPKSIRLNGKSFSYVSQENNFQEAKYAIQQQIQKKMQNMRNENIQLDDNSISDKSSFGQILSQNKFKLPIDKGVSFYKIEFNADRGHESEQVINSPSKLLIPSQFSNLRFQDERKDETDQNLSLQRKRRQNPSFFQNSFKDRRKKTSDASYDNSYDFLEVEQNQLKITSFENLEQKKQKKNNYNLEEEELDDKFFRQVDKVYESNLSTNKKNYIKNGLIPTFNEMELGQLIEHLHNSQSSQIQQYNKTKQGIQYDSQKRKSSFLQKYKSPFNLDVQQQDTDNQIAQDKSQNKKSIVSVTNHLRSQGSQSSSSYDQSSKFSEISSVSKFEDLEVFKFGQQCTTTSKSEEMIIKKSNNQSLLDKNDQNVNKNSNIIFHDEDFINRFQNRNKERNSIHQQDKYSGSAQNTKFIKGKSEFDDFFSLNKNEKVAKLLAELEDDNYNEIMEMDKELLSKKHFIAKVNYLQPSDYTEQILPKQLDGRKLQKKLENERRIKNIKLRIMYMLSQHNNQKKKKNRQIVNYLKNSHQVSLYYSQQIKFNQLTILKLNQNFFRQQKDNNVFFPIRKSKLIDEAFMNEFKQWVEGQNFTVDQWIDFNHSLSQLKQKQQLHKPITQQVQQNVQISRESQSLENNQEEAKLFNEISLSQNEKHFKKLQQGRLIINQGLLKKSSFHMWPLQKKNTNQSLQKKVPLFKRQKSQNRVFPLSQELVNDLDNYQIENKGINYQNLSDKFMKQQSIKGENESGLQLQGSELLSEIDPNFNYQKSDIDMIKRKLTLGSVKKEFPFQDPMAVSDISSLVNTPIPVLTQKHSENEISNTPLSFSPQTKSRHQFSSMVQNRNQNQLKQKKEKSSQTILGSSISLKNKTTIQSQKRKGNLPIRDWNFLRALNLIFPEPKEKIGEKEEEYFGESEKEICSLEQIQQSDIFTLEGGINDQQDEKSFIMKKGELLKHMPTLGSFQNSTTIHTQSTMVHTNTIKSQNTTVTSKTNEKVNIINQNNNQDNKEQEENDPEVEHNIRLELILKEPLNKIYLQIRNFDLFTFEKKKQNQQIKVLWSGQEIIQDSIQQKSNHSLMRIVSALNYIPDDLEINQQGIIGLINHFRIKIKKLTQSSNYESALLIFVIINTIMLSLDGLPSSKIDNFSLYFYSKQDKIVEIEQFGNLQVFNFYTINKIVSSSTFDNFNLAATIIFTLDMTLKLIGLGINEYITDRMNLFDSFIVFLSLTELVFLDGTGGKFNAFRSVRIVRTFRVLRITKLLRQLQFMKIIVVAMSNIIEQVMYILLLVVLFIFIYTLLGMQIYGGTFLETQTNRLNFDSFFIASLSVFDLLTLENWNDMLVTAIRSTSLGFITPLFFISCTFIGNYILMNLLLAIMIGAFDTEDIKVDRADVENAFFIVEDISLNNQEEKGGNELANNMSNSNLQLSQQNVNNILSKDQHSNNNLNINNPSITANKNSIINTPVQFTLQRNNSFQINSPLSPTLQKGNTLKDSNLVQAFQQKQSSIFHRKYTKIQLKGLDDDESNNSDSSNSDNHLENFTTKERKEKEKNNEYRNYNQKDKQQEKKTSLLRLKPKQQNKFQYFKKVECERSLYIFSKQSKFRQMCYQISVNSTFEKIIMQKIFNQPLIFHQNSAIVFSSLKLVSDTYMDQLKDNYSNALQVSKIFDIIITLFFALETTTKIIANGLFQDQNSYLRESWSQLDFFIVICSLIDISVESINLSAIKILRLLRTLRPLRILSHNKSMKLIVNSLIESVSNLFNIIVVIFILWLMFAILGVNLMKGKMNYCNFPNNGLIYSEYSYNEQQCLSIEGAKWDTYEINFDNTIDGMITLFILSTLEGWPVYCLKFMDASDSGPIKNNSSYFAIFFIVFILVGSFFSVNLFGAVMAFNYDIASKKSKNKYLSEEQAQWIELQHLILKSTPDFASIKPPQNKFRKFIWNICESWFLEVFITGCIILNVITMAMIYETASFTWNDTLSTINLYFTGIFIGESLMKIISYGFGGYLYKDSNKFDFFVVCASLIDIALSYTGKTVIKFVSSGPQLARIFRVFRVTRLLRLVESLKNLQKLINTAIYALPALMNAISLLLLVYFIFSVLGCYLFSSYNNGDELNSFWNFSTFHRSFMLLFRQSTGENWYIFMFDVVRNTNKWSVLFFILFITAQQYIMMNLFILIIIDQFQQNYINPDNPLNNFKEQESEFKKIWVKMTQEEQGVKIHERTLTELYFQLNQPLGFGNVNIFKINLTSSFQSKGYQTKLKEFLEKTEQLQQDMTPGEKKIMIDRFRIKQVQEAEKRIMQMNIFCDYEGYIYFNELIYAFFRYSIIHSLTKNINEFQTMEELEKYQNATEIIRKEEKIMSKKLLFIKKKVSKLTHQKFSHKRQQGVNPIVRRFFIGLCFNSWKNYSDIKQENIYQNNGEVDDISSQSESDDEDGQHHNDIVRYMQVIKQQQNIDEDYTSDIINRLNKIKLTPNKSPQQQDDKNEDSNKSSDIYENKRRIVPRQHTFAQRLNNISFNQKDSFQSLTNKQKYLFLPDADIYKDLNQCECDSQLQIIQSTSNLNNIFSNQIVNQNSSMSNLLFNPLKNKLYQKRVVETESKNYYIQDSLEVNNTYDFNKSKENSIKNKDISNIQFSMSQMNQQDLFETTDFLDFSKNIDFDRKDNNENLKKDVLEQIQENEDN